MFRLLFFYSPSSPINGFLIRQICEANLPFTDIYFIELNDEIVDLFDILEWHTVMFIDTLGTVLVRKDGPFSSRDLEILLDSARLKRES